MDFSLRLHRATTAAACHFLVSVAVAFAVAAVVFGIWYPAPYHNLSGGLNLFLIVVGVDVVCGPLLTLVVFNPCKSRRELLIDLALIAVIQVGALAYGIHTAYQARPLFLVHEVDRFRAIGMPDFGNENDVKAALKGLEPSLQPRWHKGPITVGIRIPNTREERQSVLFESIFGGRDYSQRPEFYIPYDEVEKERVLRRARPAKNFAAHYPKQSADLQEILKKTQTSMEKAFFLPVQQKQEWVAILNDSAIILGFLPGDGFEVP